MAVIEAPSIHDRIYTGHHGNKSVYFSDFTMNLEENDEIRVFKLPIGLRVFGFRYAHEALGAATEIEVKIGEQVLGTIDASVENANMTVIDPFYLTDESDLTLIAKADDAVGRLAVIIEYISTGY